MNTMLSISLIKKISLCVMLVIFTFTMVYTPQVHKPDYASAQTATVEAPGPSLISQIETRINSTITAARTNFLAYVAQQGLTTNSVLDGIAWVAAKKTISMIQRSLVRWINSGFKGSPAFIQDLPGFVTNIADETMGTILQELGGPLSIICSPFRLNVRIALATAYNRSRDKNLRRCTLTGALENLQGFINGDMRQGGWGTWMQIVHQPNQYSQYGSLLEASYEASISITNAQGYQLRLSDWGTGFLSSKVCDDVRQPDGTTRQENCRVSTPGSVIATQLNETLGLGHASLVAADEINEIIGALMEQLVLQAVTGAQGLLGMGGAGSKYTNPNFNVDSYADGMELETDPTIGRKLLVDSLQSELELLALGRNLMDQYVKSDGVDGDAQNRAWAAYQEAAALMPGVQSNVTYLEQLLKNYDSGGPNEQQKILEEYTRQSLSFNNSLSVDGYRQRWAYAMSGMVLRNENTLDKRAIDESLALEEEYLDLANAVIDAYEIKPGADVLQTAAYNEARLVLPDIQDNIIDLKNLVINYDRGGSKDEKDDILNDYSELKNNLHTEEEIDAARSNWLNAYPDLAP